MRWELHALPQRLEGRVSRAKSAYVSTPNPGREERFVDMLPPEEWPPPTEVAAKGILALAATLTEVS